LESGKQKCRGVFALLEAGEEGAAGGGGVGGVEDSGDDAKAAGTGSDDGVHGLEVDAADGEPGDGNMGGGPADVVEGDGAGAGFGAGGVDGADGEVIRTGGEGAFGLLRSVGGEADGEIVAGQAEFGDVPVAGVEEVFLAEVAEVGAEFAGEGEVVVDDEADAGGAGDGEDGFSEAADFIEGGVFGAELDEVGAAVAELAGEAGGVAAVEVGGVDEGVEAAVGQRFHAGIIGGEEWRGKSGERREVRAEWPLDKTQDFLAQSFASDDSGHGFKEDLSG